MKVKNDNNKKHQCEKSKTTFFAFVSCHHDSLPTPPPRMPVPSSPFFFVCLSPCPPKKGHRQVPLSIIVVDIFVVRLTRQHHHPFPEPKPPSSLDAHPSSLSPPLSPSLSRSLSLSVSLCLATLLDHCDLGPRATFLSSVPPLTD
ncbi:hypothetical protein LY76DRAFT_166079 [Colletotrichum caudatum]|nr:hypothetical protein LY76DRAFT_166079 [Colletotrichum caudatum]